MPSIYVRAATGQEALNVATHFDEALKITGSILTKLDGDARGVRDAALHVLIVTDEGDDSPRKTGAGDTDVEPYLVEADAYVFSSRPHVPPGLRHAPMAIIPPCIDPLSLKNRELARADVASILGSALSSSFHFGWASSSSRAI